MPTRPSPTPKENMEPEIRQNVQVITAGGAAIGRKKNKRRSKYRASKNDSAAAAGTLSDADNSTSSTPAQAENPLPAPALQGNTLEIEQESDNEDNDGQNNDGLMRSSITGFRDDPTTTGAAMMATETTTSMDMHHHTASSSVYHPKRTEIVWLFICFVGIMASFVCYGLLLEYTTSGGRQLHELSFLFVTSALYTITAAAGRYVRDEQRTTIPPARFAILGLTSMGSTFCSVRSLRYVIYPIQVLAKSCKPVPVMLMGALMGKRYSARKYINVLMIVAGVAMFCGGGGDKKKATSTAADDSSSSQLFGIALLFVSLCFDGGTGAYEDKLMSVHSVQPFDLMYNIQLGKTILAGVALLVLNQIHIFIQMCQDMGFLLVALGLSGALGQVFIFVTIAKFGALTCSIIGLARKVTTLVASIYFYGHYLNGVQMAGLALSIMSMVMNFCGKKGGGGHGHGPPALAPPKHVAEEMEKMLDDVRNEYGEQEEEDDVELATKTSSSPPRRLN